MMIGNLTESSVRKAETQLRKADKVLAALIKKNGPCSLYSRRGPAFHTLAWSIIGQQLSTKAASSLVQRVSTVVPRPFRPRYFASLRPEQLREVGLSMRKATCLITVAHRMGSGEITFAKLRHKSDEDIVLDLTQISGIGRWTAEMFLIFGMGRPDVLSLSDAGLQRAARSLYGNNADLNLIGQAWTPWRSVASWYLWRHLDT